VARPRAVSRPPAPSAARGSRAHACTKCRVQRAAAYARSLFGPCITHLLIMWGCLLAAAITFPLVCGWLHFQPMPAVPALYEAVVLGFAMFRFPHESTIALFLFHGLVWLRSS
jgi:hypothetical protein